MIDLKKYFCYYLFLYLMLHFVYNIFEDCFAFSKKKKLSRVFIKCSNRLHIELIKSKIKVKEIVWINNRDVGQMENRKNNRRPSFE